MRRILFVALAVAAIAAIAVPAPAQAATKLGIGYFRTDAPLGVRAWVAEKVAVDAGIGFTNMDEMNGTGKLEKKTSFCFDAGLPLVLVGDEETKWFVRPGITFKSVPVWDTGANDWATSKEFWVAGSLGVEHWFGKKFAIGAAHGIIFKSLDPGTKNSKTSSEIMTEGLGIATVGFHFYFD